jgi:hypothetical protein
VYVEQNSAFFGVQTSPSTPLKITLTPLVKNTYFKLFLSKSHEIYLVCSEKILRLIGYKGHRVHNGGHVDPDFLGQNGPSFFKSNKCVYLTDKKK